MAQRLRSMVLSFLLLHFILAAGAQTSNSHPNIVLIVSDDHGREAIGCYGNKVVQTPNIDTLAKEDILFTNAFATVASCSPSRSVLLSGLYSHSNGMYGLQHQIHHFSSYDTVQSLPVLLEKAGYRTARIGKYHVGPEQVFRFQKILQGATVDDPNSIGRSPVLMADLCNDFIKEDSNQPFFLYYAQTILTGAVLFCLMDCPTSVASRPTCLAIEKKVIHR